MSRAAEDPGALGCENPRYSPAKRRPATAFIPRSRGPHAAPRVRKRAVKTKLLGVGSTRWAGGARPGPRPAGAHRHRARGGRVDRRVHSERM